MKKVNNKKNNRGFTLIELIAVFAILGIVATISGVTVTSMIKRANDSQYKLLVSNIKNAVESYYQECTYGGTLTCKNNINLEYLVDNGFISGNANGACLTDAADGSCTKYKKILALPDSGESIMNCEIEWKFESGEVTITSKTSASVNPNCPSSY